MKFSEEKLKKMTKEEVAAFAQIIGVKYSAKASKEDIIGLLLGLNIENKSTKNMNKKKVVKAEPKAKNKKEASVAITAPKKRGRPLKAESTAKEESTKKVTISTLAPKKRGRPAKAETAKKADIKTTAKKETAISVAAPKKRGRPAKAEVAKKADIIYYCKERSACQHSCSPKTWQTC